MITNRIFFYAALLLTFVTIVNCKSTYSRRAENPTYKEIYIDQFKLTYFRKILVKANNNSEAIQEIINADHSGFAEPILTADDYVLIDSLTTVDNDNIKIDSARGNRRAEGAKGKRSLGFILDKLSSKWLDSLAKKRYKISRAGQSISE